MACKSVSYSILSNVSLILVQDDGWDTEPFTLVDKDGKLYGRGSTDDKVNIFLV